MNPITKAFNFPEEILSKYDIIQEMGRGAFSTVYKIKSKKDNTIYCLKKINIKKTPDRKNEVNILSKLNHPNLVKYISSYEDEEGIYIIMEFCIYGDLYSLLHMVKKKKVYVNEEIIWDIVYQCLLGLEYLHSQQIIHRDIKLLNIFMSTNKIVKIGDMGMSKILSKKEMKLSRVGTPLFLAPELVMKEKYDFKADIWSLGCSIYHLAKTAPPFNDENLIKLGQSIVNDNPPELPGCYSDDLKFFVNKLMTKNKKSRPNATEALTYIPQKIKDKFGKYNDKNSNIKKSEEKKQGMKSINNQKNNTSINNNEINNSKYNNDNKNIMNHQKLLNIPKSPIKESNNELISGQTFYKFFRKNTDKSQRKLTSSILGLKKGKISSSLFDSKNMNSLLIMSKTMGGTREGFFRHKNMVISPSLPVKEEIKAKLEQKQPEEQKGTENKNKNIINKLPPEKKELEKKKENDKNELNEGEEIKTEHFNKIKDEYKTKENDVWIRGINFNFSNRNFKGKEIKKLNNFFIKKNKNKTKSEIGFFNPNNFAFYSSYQKNKNQNIDLNNKIKFPLIQQRKSTKIMKNFNNNIIINNKIEQAFRKTADSFNINNKLTIHDLK